MNKKKFSPFLVVRIRKIGFIGTNKRIPLGEKDLEIMGKDILWRRILIKRIREEKDTINSGNTGNG